MIPSPLRNGRDSEIRRRQKPQIFASPVLGCENFAIHSVLAGWYPALTLAKLPRLDDRQCELSTGSCVLLKLLKQRFVCAGFANTGA